MALASGACGQSAEAIVGADAPDEGVLSTRPMPAWVSETPDASGGRSSSGASPSFSGDETNPASTFPTPGVWTAPAGMELPCLNVRMAFDFNEWGEPESDKEAFWMMWFAMRSFASDQPATAEELASIGFIHYASFDRPATALQAYVAASDKAIVVAFRGTTQWADWVRNFDFAQAPGAPLGLAGHLHRGYAAAIAEVWDDLARTVRAFDAPRKPVWIAGHSLGGALATLAATRFAKTTPILPRLVTFAAPRTGDQAFVQDSLVALRGRYRRIENERDLVPHLPPSAAASEPFAALAPAEILSTPVQSLVRRLDYAHGYPLTLLRDDGTKHDVFGEGSTSGADDIVYWHELAQQARARGVRTLAEVSANQGVRHNERTYLCRMRAWHEAAEHAKARAQDHHGSNR